MPFRFFTLARVIGISDDLYADGKDQSKRSGVWFFNSLRCSLSPRKEHSGRPAETPPRTHCQRLVDPHWHRGRHYRCGRRPNTPSRFRLPASSTIHAIRPVQCCLSAGRHYTTSRVCIRETGTGLSNRGAISVVYIVHHRLQQGFCLHSLARRSTLRHRYGADLSSYFNLHLPAPLPLALSISAKRLSGSICGGRCICGRTWFLGASRLSPRITRLRHCRLFIVFAGWVSSHQELASDKESGGLVCAWRSIKYSKWVGSVCRRTRTKTLR